MTNPPVKYCPQCQQPAQVQQAYCMHCGHQFRTQFDQFGNPVGPPAPPPVHQAPPPQHPYGAPPPGPYAPPPEYRGAPPPPGYGYPNAMPDSNRLLITLLLWFFLGGFGAHRFFLGHTGTAIIMLVLTFLGVLTYCLIIGIFILAAVGIWSFIDLVLILTGNLRPVDGSRII